MAIGCRRLVAMMTGFVAALAFSPRTAQPVIVDAVVSGHAHFIDEVMVGRVPIIQSGANGKAYGRREAIRMRRYRLR
jgi:2',3'-cyclic-nucleotide 2'-phosphodiesterase (5'-nucleotidase family)